MRKNLTVSLSNDDWRKVKAIAESLDETYSSVFHRLIELGTSSVGEEKRIARYKAALAPHARFLARRAGALARAGRGRKAPA